MFEFFRELFDTDFMPHVYCLRSPGLVWLHAISDGLIAFAYFLIPLGLLRLVHKRKDLAFHWLFILFAVFILSCGATHVLEIVTLWTPIYRFAALVKVVTALASLLTAVLLIRLIPKIAILPSPEQWRKSNEELLVLNTQLELRVKERTKELEEKNDRLQALTAAWDLAHGCIRDLEGNIKFWCQGSQELYGWNKQDAEQRNSHELLKTQFPRPLAEINLELLEKGSWSGELVHSTREGPRLTVATHWVLQRDSGDGSLSVIEVNNDVSDRLRADEAMQRLADLVESSNDAIIGTNLDGVITSWNRSAETVFGYRAAEILGESIDRLIPRTNEDADWNPEAPQIGSRHRETVSLTKGGREIAISVSVSPIRNSAGGVIGRSHIVHNISEAKAREEAFRLSEERQRLAVEAGQIGLWYLDTKDGKCIWTQRSKELHGLTADSKVPDYPGILSLIHPDDCQAVESAFTEAIEGKSGIILEYRTRGLDFRTKWLQMKGQVQHDLGGRVKGIHGTVIDLTARREMEDKLRRANIELEQFAYAAAHDLQEPLRNVALAAALIQTAKQDPARQIATRRWASQAGMSQEPVSGGIAEKVGENEWNSIGEASQASGRELLAVVIENAQRMEAMIKDLLAYSRALDTAEDQAPEADGSVILARVLGNFTAEIKERRAEITSDPLPVLAIQEAHLTQIMQNLIGNALTYSGPRPPRVHIGASTRPGDVLLYVRDNGIGIEPQFHRRAFGMFKRLHRSGAKGTGIGLAVCKRIVEHYGGKIWIESAAGEGATFYFTVPSHTP